MFETLSPLFEPEMRDGLICYGVPIAIAVVAILGIIYCNIKIKQERKKKIQAMKKLLILFCMISLVSCSDYISRASMHVTFDGDGNYTVIETFHLNPDQVGRYGFYRVENAEFVGIKIKKK